MSNTDAAVPAPEPTDADPVFERDVERVAERDAEDAQPDAPAPTFQTPAVGSGLSPDALEAELDDEADTPRH